jgi:menaquinone-dependent protoporphyrinogen oxidase
MPKHLLIAYATRAGSTTEVAAALGHTLAARGFTVDVRPIKDQPSLTGYNAVLLGSAIRMGRWLPEAVVFVQTNQAALNLLPVALFTVHALNRGDDLQSLTSRQAYLDTVRPLLQPLDEIYFSGKLDLSTLTLPDRLLARLVKADPGDFRDWTKISSWAQTVFA